jgi:glutathione S-transferase
MVSPYSAKTRSYLRYSGVVFTDIEPGAITLYRRIQPAVGRMIMPTVLLPDGSWLQDSSAIIDHFEAREDTPSIVPPGPTQRVASALLEVFADEWLPMAALHYRWNIDANAEFALTEFARSGFSWLPTALGRPLVRNMAGKMQSYLPLLGVTEATQAAVEQTVQIVLRCLEAQLQDTDFVLGDRPCLGDFALFGPLWAHLYRDPGSRFLFENAPAVTRWMERLSSQPVATGDFGGEDHIPAHLGPLFRCILTDQWAWITTLEAAINEYCEAHPEATRVPRALGEAGFQIQGIKSRRKLVTLVQWKAQRARSAYLAADGRADGWLREVLDLGSGVEVGDRITNIRHPFIMRNFKPILLSHSGPDASGRPKE